MQQWDLRRDYHSFANSDMVRIQHLSLVLSIDFDLKQINGEASLQFERLSADATLLVLDTRELIIASVTDEQGLSLDWAFGESSAILGTALFIALPNTGNRVIVNYATSMLAEGLQWLDGAQTQSGKPFLFSQSQPINARSWIPLQDTPKVRITFDATVSANRHCRIVMSALNADTVPNDGIFHFRMDKPMSTHLLAIAAGELERIEIGPRSAVFAEAQTVSLAAAEFEDIEAMMQMAESILGPYVWGRYDMLILPPSFPFGGMENPCLAFLTPTLIAGDKSLVSTVAHELAHSWTGNLVSNATWRDLWLNEGFTTYFTNRIVEAVYGKPQAELELMIEYGRLKEEMAIMPLQRQTLPANLQQGDPNEAFNRFTYDKASMFVHFLESRIGRNAFDRFLKAYIEAFAFVAITTEDFITYARNTLLREHADKLSEAELLAWIYGEGLPDSFCAPKSGSLASVELALERWRAGSRLFAADTRDWRVQHWQYFMTHLPTHIPQARLIELDDSFKLGRSGNAEMACDWLRIAIHNQYTPAIAEADDFLCRVGRAKFVRPLFLALQSAGFHSELAIIYNKVRPRLHPSLSVQLTRLLSQD